MKNDENKTLQDQNHCHDKLEFADELPPKTSSTDVSEAPWKILVLDDEPEVHKVTRLVFSDYEFEKRGVEFLSACSHAEGKKVFDEHADISLVLLDVVMEKIDAGLKFVEYIRNESGNQKVRIILRTGFPGDYPEEKVIHDYDINDYHIKTDLTRDRLLTAVTVALRGYRDLMQIHSLHEELEKRNRELNRLNESLEVLVEKRTKTLRSKTLELRLKNKQLRNLNAENHNLIQIMCHDLNNALCIVKSSASVGERKAIESSDDLAGTWSRILRASKTQENIVRHVAEMEAIKSGELKFVPEPVDLKEVIDGSLFVFRDKLNEKKIEIQTENLKQNKFIVMADSASLTNIVFNNLLSNAIKFSFEQSKIKIGIERGPGQKILVRMQDYGIGIPDDMLKELFNPGKKNSRTGTAGEKGIGFGMTLLKTYMDQYKGLIHVSSAEKCNEDHKEHGTIVDLVFKAA